MPMYLFLITLSSYYARCIHSNAYQTTSLMDSKNTINLDKTAKEQYDPGPPCYRDLQQQTTK